MSLKAKNQEELMKMAVEQIEGVWANETLFAYKPYIKA
jgi:hypothetical protein